VGVVTAPVSVQAVAPLAPFFAAAAAEEGFPVDPERVCVLVAEATLGVASGLTRIWTAHAPALPHVTVGLFQVDERTDTSWNALGTLYEARRLYVRPEWRRKGVARALLARAAAELPDDDALILFTTAGELPRSYRRMGGGPVRVLHGVSLQRARGVLLKPKQKAGDLWAALPSRSR
jgi:GNAT superfamily N-acetyltransferase